MDVLDGIKHMMKESGTTAVQLSADLGRSRNFVSSTFTNKADIGTSNAAKMANLMGWHLVLKKGDVEVEITPRD